MQGELERALGVLLRVDACPLTVAGRTDAGVHAWGQVASYPGPPVSVASLNALLPADVAALSCEPAPEGFERPARRHLARVLLPDPGPALAQRILAPVGHCGGPTQSISMRSRVRAALVGLHDFTAFTPTETDHVRFSREVFAAKWRRSGADGELIEFWIEADAFMRHMNRVLVGTMLEVA